MIKSMTGYGRFEGVIDGRNVVFEIKSVNHRFLELQCRTPRGCGFIEETIKNLVSRYVTRGKADVFVSIEADENLAAEVTLNRSLATGYVNALRELRDEYGLADDISVSSVAKYNDIFTVRKAPENEEKICSIVQQAGTQALEAFVAMREREGEKLKADVLSRCDTIIGIVEEIEKRSPQIVEEYRQRLYERISEILNDTTAEPQRILTEAAIFADKTADEIKADIAGYQSKAKIPLLIGADEEGGTVVRVSDNPNLRDSAFLSPKDTYASGGWEAVESAECIDVLDYVNYVDFSKNAVDILYGDLGSLGKLVDKIWGLFNRFSNY